MESDGHNSRQPRTFRSIVSSWKYEMLACLVAILMIIAEIASLAHYDHKPTWFWGAFGWKINSVFGLVTAVLEAAVATSSLPALVN